MKLTREASNEIEDFQRRIRHFDDSRGRLSFLSRHTAILKYGNRSIGVMSIDNQSRTGLATRSQCSDLVSWYSDQSVTTTQSHHLPTPIDEPVTMGLSRPADDSADRV